ncbi:hypothetical protein PPYR_14655 [Photinus pyralis]|uniref:Secreted protein n=1 Tax=Photinus pyralis TaxID=7054 RepID=A0A5N4A5T4_PHOPY|nr:uncharacterized protein LOC116181439 [Photinus pyralis]KAB0792696.1 hypothetical protein PPYR_14655 [Photinus pyralis]
MKLLFEGSFFVLLLCTAQAYEVLIQGLFDCAVANADKVPMEEVGQLVNTVHLIIECEPDDGIAENFEKILRCAQANVLNSLNRLKYSFVGWVIIPWTLQRVKNILDKVENVVLHVITIPGVIDCLKQQPDLCKRWIRIPFTNIVPDFTCS